jgi:hypothetical protein
VARACGSGGWPPPDCCEREHTLSQGHIISCMVVTISCYMGNCKGQFIFGGMGEAAARAETLQLL